MRPLILLLFLPLSLFSQELPDSTIAEQLGVKKLVILQQSKGNPIDTFGVFILDGKWKDGNSKADTLLGSQPIISDDSNGRAVFTPDNNTDPKCKSDSLGILHRYDKEGKLIQWVYYTCESKKMYLDYYYDVEGRLSHILSPGEKGVSGFREEYIYDKSGRLVYINEWYAANPASENRIKGDFRHSRVTFYYDKNGLIKESVLEDPLNITGNNYSEENEDGDPLPNVKFTYIYIFSE